MDKIAMGAFTGILILSMAGAWWYLNEQTTLRAQNEPPAIVAPSDDTPVQHPNSPGASIGDENLVQFECDGGKALTAVFTRDILAITLSDGRQMELREVETASSVRYHNINGSVQFHAAGEGGYLEEGGETTYANCVALI